MNRDMLDHEVTDIITRLMQMAGRLAEAKLLMTEAIERCETCPKTFGERCGRCQSFQAFLGKE